MKKGIIIGSVLLLAFLLAGCTATPPDVGVIDMDIVLKDSQRAEQLKNELSQIGNTLEEDYKQREEELSGDKKEKELEKIYQEFVNNKQRLENQLNQEIKNIIAEVAKEEKVDVVINKKTVHFGGKDITEKVINRLDEKFSKGGADINDEEGTQE